MLLYIRFNYIYQWLKGLKQTISVLYMLRTCTFYVMFCVAQNVAHLHYQLELPCLLRLMRLQLLRFSTIRFRARLATQEARQRAPGTWPKASKNLGVNILYSTPQQEYQESTQLSTYHSITVSCMSIMFFVFRSKSPYYSLHEYIMIYPHISPHHLQNGPIRCMSWMSLMPLVSRQSDFGNILNPEVFLNNIQKLSPIHANSSAVIYRNSMELCSQILVFSLVFMQMLVLRLGCAKCHLQTKINRYLKIILQNDSF